MRTIEDAIELALIAHRGQVDKQGVPYILHPLRVMEAVRHEGYPTMMAAVLHDVVEDTTVTLQQLRDAKYPDEVVEAVDALSRRKEESYKTYIRRLEVVPMAKVIKIADVLDNRSRMTPEMESLGRRYSETLRILGVPEQGEGPLDRRRHVPIPGDDRLE